MRKYLHSDISVFTPVRHQVECNPRVLFEQSTESQEPNQEVARLNQEVSRLELQTINNQPVSKGSGDHQRQEILPQRIRS